jgi:hypothetical protein
MTTIGAVMKPPEERLCPECGTTFVVNGLGRKKVTCSPECASERNKRAHREFARRKYVPRVNTRPLLVCPTCGKSFQPLKSHQKYCNRICTQKGIDAERERSKAQRVCRKCGIPVERKPGYPVCKDCKIDKRYRQKYERRRTLRTYGLTAEEWDKMLSTQGGRCPICGTDDPGPRGFDVDHDHLTGANRGLLCSPCNRGLGQFGDDPARLQAAIEYLAAHAAQAEKEKKK